MAGGGGKGRLLLDKFFLIIPGCDLHVTTAGSKATCGFGIGEFPVELSSLLVFHTKSTKSQATGPTKVINWYQLKPALHILQRQWLSFSISFF